MIGELFTINVSNIGRTAIAQIARTLPADSPVSIMLVPAEHGAMIEVGATIGIAVEEQVVAQILQIQDPVACRNACQDYIDELASQLRAAVAE